MNRISSETLLTFQGKTATDNNGKFQFQIIDILKINNDNFYVMDTKNDKEIKRAEILFVLTPELYYGLIGEFTNADKQPDLSDIKNNFKVHFVVKYDKMP